VSPAPLFSPPAAPASFSKSGGGVRSQLESGITRSRPVLKGLRFLSDFSLHGKTQLLRQRFLAVRFLAPERPGVKFHAAYRLHIR